MLLAGVSLDRAVARALRRRAPPLLAGRAAARRPRPDRARRAHQPPRRRGGRLAGRPPGRPVRPRWSWSPTTGGSSTRSASGRGRCTTASSTPTRAGTPRSCWPRPSGSARPSASETRRQNLARKELAWLRRGAAGADLEAEVPHRRRQRADRGRAAAAGPAGAAEVRDPAARQGRHRRRGRRPRPRRAHAARRTPPGGSGPGDRVGIVGVNGAGKTLGARRCSPGRWRRGAGRVKQRPHGRAAAPHPAARRPRPGRPGCCRWSSRSAG